ncbi:MAG: hypothetical protein ACRD0L_05605 [Acidimicrobiales bacterium]
MSTTRSSPRRPPVFGPEPCEEIGGSSWSHWDRWFCAVAVADHGASLDQLEERLVSELQDRTGSRESTESKLSHLADLRACLSDAGLVPGDLATPEVLSERGLLAKARKTLAERYLEGRAKTPAMIETPRVRIERRARTGHWDAFPVDPERYYRSFRRNVEVKDHISKNRSFSAVRRIEERLASLDKAGFAVAGRLALHRAFHTAGLELADRADDSFGNVGEMRREAWHTYLGVDWQAAGMAPEDYWADLCDLVVFEDYALEFKEETLPWSHVPAGQAKLVEAVLLALEAECRAFHLDYPADQALEQLAWLAVAGRRFTCYVEVASRLGTDHWREVEALAESALRSKRRDLAVEVFQAADRPGRHQQRLWERCASLTGVVIGDTEDGRISLRAVPRSSKRGAQG